MKAAAICQHYGRLQPPLLFITPPPPPPAAPTPVGPPHPGVRQGDDEKKRGGGWREERGQTSNGIPMLNTVCSVFVISDEGAVSEEQPRSPRRSPGGKAIFLPSLIFSPLSPRRRTRSGSFISFQSYESRRVFLRLLLQHVGVPPGSTLPLCCYTNCTYPGPCLTLPLDRHHSPS